MFLSDCASCYRVLYVKKKTKESVLQKDIHSQLRSGRSLRALLKQVELVLESETKTENSETKFQFESKVETQQFQTNGTVQSQEERKLLEDSKETAPKGTKNNRKVYSYVPSFGKAKKKKSSPKQHPKMRGNWLDKAIIHLHRFALHAL